MKNTKPTILPFSIFALSIFILSQIIACGGGGGGGNSTSEPVSMPQEPISTDLQTLDLIAPDDFNFKTSRKVSVYIDLPELNNRRAFVSIFSQYSSTNDAKWQPDFDSRLVMEKLQSGKMKQYIQLTHDVQIVLIQVWTDNRLEPPFSREASVENNQINWQM